MPILPFESLPDTARVWVFGSERALDDDTHDRFLTIAVDQSTAGASGCSIDGLYRALRALEGALGASLLTSGLLFYVDAEGVVASVPREEFAERARRGEIGRDTTVFDLTVESLGEWRERFEAPVHAGWHARLL
jgi:hypothetical protein